jgi:hypothetical protein
MHSCTVAVSWLFQYRCSVEALQSCTVNNCIVSVQLPWSWWVHPHLKLDSTQSETLCFSAVCCSLVSQNHSSLIFKIDPISNSQLDVQKTWRRKSGLFPALNVDGASGVRTVRTPLGPSILWAGKRPHNWGPVLPANSRQCLEIFCFTVLYFSLPQQVLSFNH